MLSMAVKKPPNDSIRYAVGQPVFVDNNFQRPYRIKHKFLCAGWRYDLISAAGLELKGVAPWRLAPMWNPKEVSQRIFRDIKSE